MVEITLYISRFKQENKQAGPNKAMCNKISYETKAQAQEQAKLIRHEIKHFRWSKKNKKTNKKGNMKAYLCPNCDKWHLTSISKTKFKHIQKRKP